MSQAMNRKTATKKKKKSPLAPVEEHVELTGAEKLFEHVKPHLSTIGLAVVAGLLGFVAIAVFMRSQFDKDALQWREFANSSAIALRTGDISGLTSVADAYPDTKAGLWSLQMAGDQQLRMGIEQLSFDRDAGMDLIKKAKANFQIIVEAPKTAKTTMLDRRSHFSLAYASESLGEFEAAKALYEQIVTEAPDSAFAGPARRGVVRASNEDYAELYSKFVNWEEEVIGDAPGPPIPPRPVIDEFQDVDLPPGTKPPAEGAKSGGDFGSADPKVDSSTEKTEDKAAESTEPAKEEPAKEEPESEKPSDDGSAGESEDGDGESTDDDDDK